MMRNLRLHFCGTVASRTDVAGHLKSSCDAVLIERGRPRMLVLACPCGCGEEFPINLDPRTGPAWRLYGNPGSGLTVFPSVWRESGCRSHYIIWRDKILLFGRDDEDMDASIQDSEMSRLMESVRKLLPQYGLISFSDVADQLNEIPWDVLMACRRLVRARFAREGTGKQRGSFGLL